MTGSVRVLEVDPDLGQGLGEDEFALAEHELVAATLNIDRGRWDSATTWAGVRPELGMLMIAGVLARDVKIGKRASLEILGPGDFLHPWPTDRHAAAFAPELRFDALEPVEFAVLDSAFVEKAARWPSVIGQIVGRGMGRATSASLRLLIHQVVRIDDRVLLSLWGLAERFGRVTPDGVLVPVPINHTMMARFVGAQRPTVSQAVGELVRRGDVVRLEDGGWLLKGSFPTQLLDGTSQG